MPLFFMEDELSHISVDAIVNLTNSSISLDPEICSVNFSTLDAQNYHQLRKACRHQVPCILGQAVVTESYGLPAKYIIHTVGPVEREDKLWNEALLCNYYHLVLKMANSLGCHSVALPVIPFKELSDPNGEGMRIARTVAAEFLQTADLDIYLVIPNKNSFLETEGIENIINQYVVDKESLKSFLIDISVGSIIDIVRLGTIPAANAARHQTAKHFAEFLKKRWEGQKSQAAHNNEETVPAPELLNEAVTHLAPSFSNTLFQIIEQKGYTDVEVYKRANMDRRLFAKTRKDEKYHPQKKTALALAIGLQLTYEETEDFLQRAGYSLSNSQKGDRIITCFLKQQDYDIHLINLALFYFGEEQL